MSEVGHVCESCSARVGKLFKSGDGRSLCHACSVGAFWKQRCEGMEVALRQLLADHLECPGARSKGGPISDAYRAIAKAAPPEVK